MGHHIGRNDPASRLGGHLVLTVIRWVGAVVSVLLLTVCVLGLFEYMNELKRRDPTAGAQLGVVILIFGLAVVFGSWLVLHSVPLRVRKPTANVLAVLIAGSWVAGLALNNGR